MSLRHAVSLQKQAMSGVYDNDERNKRAADLHDKRRIRDRSDLAKVLAMREGRRLVWRILDVAGTFSQSFAGMDICQTNFNEGRRSVGTRLLLEIPPETELVMKKEAASDKLLTNLEQEEFNG